MKKLLLFFMTFFTLLGYAQFPEGFENATPGLNATPPATDWATFTNGIVATNVATNNWQKTNVGPRGSFSARARQQTGVVNATNSLQWLVSPQVAVPANGQVRFYTKKGAPNVDFNGQLEILVSTTSQTDPTSFVPIAVPAIWNESQISTSWEQKFVLLTPQFVQGQNIFIAFVKKNVAGDTWYIDDIKVDSQCLAPTALIATPLATSATLTWDSSLNPAGPWQIEYGPAGFTQGTTGPGIYIVNATSNSTVINGLSPLTNYDFYVRTICDTDNPSPWSAVRSFTTSALPPVCGGNFVDTGGAGANYANNEDYIVTICPPNPGEYVTVTFTSFNTEANWDKLYVYDGDSTASPQISSGNGPGNGTVVLPGAFWGNTIPGPFEATGTTGCLTFRFVSDGLINNPGWTSNILCQPYPTCRKPTNITSNAISSTSVTVTWTNNAPSATQWEVIAVPAGSPAPTAAMTGQISTNPTTHTYTGLTSQTAYDFYVRAICAAGTDVGPWSTTRSTSTTNPDYCAGDHFYDSGGATGNYSNNENRTWTICPDNTGDVVTVYFNSFNLVSSVGDALTIHDGDTTAATVVGTYFGTNVISSYTATSASGCLTFSFVSNGTQNAPGWDATIVCGPPCPSITSVLNSSVPAAGSEDIIRICQGATVEFNGSGTFAASGTGATYEWNFDDGTTASGQSVSHTFANSGIYIVNLVITDTNGCRNNNRLDQKVFVSTTPDFTGTQAADDEICLGQTTTITGVVNPVEFIRECAPPVSGTTFLPDGSGVSYQTSVPVDCFPFGSTITNANQITSVCLDMEHSYLGDLELRLVSPNGQSIILKAFNGTGGGGGGTYLGCPIDGFGAADEAAGPGTGRTYCFTPAATTFLVNGATSQCGTPNDDSIVAGDYMPVQPFSNLIGSQLNGNWSLIVTDNLGADNGYIFSWSINFDNSIIPTDYSFTPTIVNTFWSPDPSIVSTSGQTITVTPTTTGNNCYIYNAVDNFGCTYTQEVCIDVEPGVSMTSNTANPLSVFVGQDGTYFFTGGTPNSLVTYNVNNGPDRQVTLDATGSATVILNGLTVDTTVTATLITQLIPTPANVIAATGGLNSSNAIGSISAQGSTANTTNSVTLNSANTLVILQLANVLPVGSTITVSVARASSTGNIRISDGVSNLNFNTGNINELQHIQFTLGNATNIIMITQLAGEIFLDGIEYIVNVPGCDAPLNLPATVEVTTPPFPFITSITHDSNICLGSNAVFNVLGSANTTVTFSINGGANETILLDAAGVGTITEILPPSDVNLLVSQIQMGADIDNTISLTRTIIVNPLGQVNPITSQTLCQGVSTNAVTFSTTNTGGTTTYTWTNSNTAIGLAASSGGNVTGIPSFVATNTTSAPITGTITVTPTYTSGGVSCVGPTETFTITVNPSGNINTILDEVVCNGGNTTAVTFGTTNTGGTTTYTWTNDTTAIGLAASSGGNATGIPSFVATNTTTAPITGTITVTPTYTNGANSCIGATETFTITVNPTAQVNVITDSEVCHSGNSTAVTFSTANTGGTTTYTWTNDNTAIGLAASSVGNATGIPSFVATNTSNAPIVGTITVTPTFVNGSVSCSGATENFTITVNISGQVNTISDEVVCPGGNTTAITFTTTNTGGTTTYTWTNSNTAIGLAASSGGTATGIPSFVATNTTASPITATITVIPTYSDGINTCVGVSELFTITVNPTGRINAISDNAFCNGSNTAAISFSTTNTGGTTTYTWTNDNTAIGLVASSGGNVTGIPSFMATNTTNAPISGTITVTPTYTNGGVSCVGNTEDFTMTVNLSGQVNSISDEVVCNGGNTTAVTFATTNTGGTTTYTWTNNNTAIGLAASSGGNATGIPSFVATNTTNAPISGTITVIPTYTSGGVSCTGASETFIITVNPSGKINTITDEVVCNGGNTTAVTFATTNTGGTTTYTWTNSNTAIGLAASSAGNVSGIPSFVATNTTTAPISGTITVTPTYSDGVLFCVGATEVFTITVNPTAQVSAVSDEVVCNGGNTTAVTFSTTNTGGTTTYTWTNDNTAIGIAASSAGNVTGIPSFVATNTTNAPISGTITVIPTYTSGGVSCTGASETYMITVNPTAQVNTITDEVVCNGGNTTAVTFGTTNTGGTATYTWTNDNTAIGLAASSAVNVTSIPSFVATNTTTAPITGTITVTPTYTNGGVSCVGATEVFTITVNPSPTLTLTSAASTTNQTICVNSPIVPIQYTFDSGATGVVVTGLPAGIGHTTNGNIVTISGTPTTTAAIFNYTITATGSLCGTPSLSGVIEVTNGILPIFAQVTPVCQGATINIPTSSNNTPPIVGVWNLISSTANDVTYEFTPDSGQCALPTRMTIVVHPLPIVTPSVTTQSFCSGGTTNINLVSDVPGSEFYWTATGTSVSGQSGSVTGSGATSINQTLTLNAGQVAAGQVTYTIVAEANGCLGAPVTVVVTVNPIPNVIVSPSSLAQTICSGGTTNISFTGAINNTVYTWSVVSSVGVSGALNGVGTSINQILTTTGLSQGTVVYEVTPSLNGCPGIPQRITVTVNLVPEIFGSTTHRDLCSGRETTNILVSTFNAATVFNWVVEPNGVTGASAGTATGLSINIVQTLTTTGNVRGYVDYIITPVLTGCSGIPITVRVYVNPLPVVSLTDGTICVDAAGVPFQSYVLDSGLNDVDYDFVWTFEGNTIPGETSSTHTANQVGTYTVVATNSTTNCVSNVASAVVTATNPATNLTVTQSEYFSDNATLVVTVTGGNGTLLYQLDQGVLQESNVFTGVTGGTHTITVVDTQGCTYLTQEVLVIDYPKYFTPNGDGHNDTWNITGMNQPEAKLYIFDRYGKLLKQIVPSSLSDGWDGTYNNVPMPSTDYWFTIDYTENGTQKQFKAHFSLKR